MNENLELITHAHDQMHNDDDDEIHSSIYHTFMHSFIENAQQQKNPLKKNWLDGFKFFILFFS